MVKIKMKHHTVARVGKTEGKILEYLACNPSQLIYSIKKALRKDIKSVHGAVKNLKTKGYLTTTPTKSEKGVEYPGYKLDEKGLAYVLAYGKKELLFKALEKYEKDLGSFRDYQQLTSLIKPKTATKLLRMSGKTILQYGEEAWLPETPLMAAFGGLGNFTNNELNELIKAAKKVSSIKIALQKRAKIFYEYVFSDEETV